MVPAYDALPTRAPYREIVLSREKLLWLPAIAVAQVRIVDVPQVPAEALLRESDGLGVVMQPGVCEDKRIGRSADDNVKGLSKFRRRKIQKTTPVDARVNPGNYQLSVRRV